MPRETIGPALALSVEVVGCDSVSRVRVRDRTRVLAEAAGQGATTLLTAPSNAVSYKERGIAADLALYADATCADGRTGASSPPVPTYFMPAAEVLAGPWPFAANFWPEGTGGSFLTCERTLKRLGRDRSVLGELALPFTCRGDAELETAPDGTRWVVQPGFGAVGFTSLLQPRVEISFEGLEQVVVSGAGLVALGRSGAFRELRGYLPPSPTPAWTRTLNGQPAGRVAVNHLGRVVYPCVERRIDSEFVDLGLATYDAATGAPDNFVVLARLQTSLGELPPIPEIALDASGSVAYFAERSDPSVVRACDATRPSSGCRSLWVAPPSLAGGIERVVVLPNTVVALGPRAAWFLEPSTGRVMGDAVLPTGSLVFTHALGGADGSLFLLAQAEGQAGIRQVLIFDRPAAQVANYRTLTVGYWVALDEAGSAWLFKSALIRLFPAEEYARALR